MRLLTAPFRVVLPFALSLLVVACSSEPESGGPASSPDAAISSSVQALRNNDISAFLAATMPPEMIQKMQTEFEDARSEPIDPNEAQQFADMMQRLTAPGAEEKLSAEIKPQLQQNAAQLPFLIGMGRGMAQSSLQQSQDLNDEQKTQAGQLLVSVADWAESADLTNPDKLDQAIAVICNAARAMELDSLEAAQALSFDDALGKAGGVLGATKELFNIYGLSMDEFLDSVSTKTVNSDDGSATVEVAYSLFGQSYDTEVQMAKAGDHWFSQGIVDEMNSPGE